MKLLSTPEERFENLPDFTFDPHFIKVDGINIHYLDEGNKQAEVILLMHGEPSWSFLYRHMIPILVKAGFRTLAPDLVGFGRSDKPTEQNDHTYLKHVEWVTKWLQLLDLQNITLFCQDWGSLIGLRLAIENQDRFNRIVLSNGGLPTGEQRMNEAFTNWREFSRTSSAFSIKRIIQGDSFKAGARILPSLVPISTDDPEHENNKKAIERFKLWEKPFLTAFSDKDPITRGGDRFWQAIIPGARNQNHTTIKNASHFVQEDKGPELAEVIIEFIKNNP